MMSLCALIERGKCVPVISLLCLPLLVCILSGCEHSGNANTQTNNKKEAVPVHTGIVNQRDMPFEMVAIGSVEAYSIISVKTQVSGIITKVWFQEGEEVKKDQTLFTIDSRPFEIALELAKADLAKAEAGIEVAHANLAKNKVQLENARTELDRNSTLLSKGVVTKEEFDRIQTTARSYEAAVLADEAAIRSASAAILGASADIEKASVELGYCTIKSPIDGKTGSLLAHRGNLVKENDTPALVVIHQIQPVYVSFTLPERNLPEVKKSMEKGPLAVTALIPDADVPAVTGTLTFLDNSVNQRTGTIRLKATFDNSQRVLWPGQFVSVRLVIDIRENAIVAPSEAIQTGQSGSYVYVLRPDATVELRNVVTGDSRDGLTIIQEGLQIGEVVVTDGHLRLAPDAKAKVVENKTEEKKLDENKVETPKGQAG